ncbi:hypothetical protein ABCV67_001207 [Pseudomonas aeruginosa]|nr:hypothetical protein [Pseudomonas aeruginosa]EKW1798255.1 hypothetical protein [Pseudomonas aeruginosa]ELD6637443.1 hypothetical protein [Pseudomonas aeruginosa]ELO5171320.1 hypothetical protein [Pseudomonas aeruginosa]
MSAMNQHQQNKASLLERLIFNNRPAVIFICLLVVAPREIHRPVAR